MKRMRGTSLLSCLLLSCLAVELHSASGAGPDPRLLLFEKFNHATTYEEVKPLVSGTLAQQFAQISPKAEQMRKVLNYLHFRSYETRIVEINDKTSFLVLEHATSTAGKEKRAAYQLSRIDGEWKLENRVESDSVIKSMWVRDFSPADFNQPSSCSVTGTNVDQSHNGKEWGLKSAVAFRKREEIEIDLLPFPQKQADLNYWKYSSGMPVDPSAFQASSVTRFYPECRIVLGLDQNGQIKFVNVGFNHPESHFSGVWQGPGWAWAPPQIPKPKTSNGLPPEFPVLEITRERVKLETAGQLDSGGQAIRWNANIDIPLWDKGL